MMSGFVLITTAVRITVLGSIAILVRTATAWRLVPGVCLLVAAASLLGRAWGRALWSATTWACGRALRWKSTYRATHGNRTASCRLTSNRLTSHPGGAPKSFVLCHGPSVVCSNHSSAVGTRFFRWLVLSSLLCLPSLAPGRVSLVLLHCCSRTRNPLPANWAFLAVCFGLRGFLLPSLSFCFFLVSF